MRVPEDGKSIVLLTVLTVDKDMEHESHRQPYTDMETAVKSTILALQSMLDDGVADYRYMKLELIEGVSKVIPVDQLGEHLEKGGVRIIGAIPRRKN